MKEKPILFNGEMVKAILDGRKTQTRRVILPQPELLREGWDGWKWKGEKVDAMTDFCPYGQPADRLWVRETFQCVHDPDGKRSNAFENTIPPTGHHVLYAATDPKPPGSAFHWKPSIYMPRWASRITLEIAAVRVERVQSISEEDAIAEGIEHLPLNAAQRQWYDNGKRRWKSYQNPVVNHWFEDPRKSYMSLWDSINAKRGFGWDTNPWVWVVEFKRIL